MRRGLETRRRPWAFALVLSRRGTRTYDANAGGIRRKGRDFAWKYIHRDTEASERWKESSSSDVRNVRVCRTG